MQVQITRVAAPPDVPVVIWTPSPFPWDGDVPWDGPLFDARCEVDGESRASLCSIAVDTLDDPYCREVERELIDEARSAA